MTASAKALRRLTLSRQQDMPPPPDPWNVTGDPAAEHLRKVIA
jgi:hypothetical protein